MALDSLGLMSYVHVMFKGPTPEDTRQALMAIVASLVAMVGSEVLRIQPSLRRQVLRLLRPAEAAVRRLIVVAARRLVVKPTVPRPKRDFKQLRQTTKGKERKASFQLCDPRPPMVPQTRRRFLKRGPRAYNIWDHEPTVAGFYAHRAMGPDPLPEPKPKDGLANATRLVRRLQAITAALEDIPKQARRLARWKARREALSATRLVYTSPLRKGPPPGHRDEPVLEIDYILQRCHWLAFEAARVDTS